MHDGRQHTTAAESPYGDGRSMMTPDWGFFFFSVVWCEVQSCGELRTAASPGFAHAIRFCADQLAACGERFGDV